MFKSTSPYCKVVAERPRRAERSASVAEKRAARKASNEKPRIKELSVEERLIKALTNPLRVELLDRLNEAEWSPRGSQTC